MLKDRLRNGILFGAAVIATAIWMPPLGILLILLGLGAIILWECYSFLDAAHIPNFKVVGTVAGLLLIGVTGWSLMHAETPGVTNEWVVILGFVLVTMVRQFPQKNNDRPLQTISSTLLGFFYVAYLFNYLTKLLLGWGAQDGRLLIIYMLVVVKLMDTGAFFTGCSIGKHKLIPRISPAKTWEGCIGGTLTGLIASVVFWAVSKGQLGVVAFTLADAIILGFVLPIAGIVGDLAESLLKRAADMKDSAQLIGGLGGMLDVVDSVLFAAPVMYIYAHFFLERI